MVRVYPSALTNHTLSRHYDNSRNRRDDILDVLVGHAGVNGQRDCPLIGMQGGREVIGSQLVRVAIERMQVQRNKVHARTDIRLLESLDKCITCDGEPLQLQAQYIEMPGVFYVCGFRWSLDLGPLRKCFG